MASWNSSATLAACHTLASVFPACSMVVHIAPHAPTSDFMASLACSSAMVMDPPEITAGGMASAGSSATREISWISPYAIPTGWPSM